MIETAAEESGQGRGAPWLRVQTRHSRVDAGIEDQATQGYQKRRFTSAR